jgi:hypothetical protein
MELEGKAMNGTFVVTGTLTDRQTVLLDEELPLGPTRVRLVVEPLPGGAKRPYAEVVAEIRRRQEARGHQPPTQEAVDAWLNAERESWGD